jgi:hypothetical protein
MPNSLSIMRSMVENLIKGVIVEEVLIDVPIPVALERFEVPFVVHLDDTMEQQEVNDHPPRNENTIDEPIMKAPELVVLRRSQRDWIYAISSYYIVYLQ